MDLPVHRVLVIGIVKMRAVFPAQAVKRRDRQQINIVGHALAAQRKEFFQCTGVGDDGGAGVKGKALVFVHIGAATRLVARFEQGGLHAGGLQPDGQRDAAKAGANHRSGFCFKGHEVLSKGRDGLLPASAPVDQAARQAAPTGTGGLPARMRALSSTPSRAA